GLQLQLADAPFEVRSPGRDSSGRPARNAVSTREDPMPADCDYIVVGSGAGGGPLAANLARAGFSVLLLEAGGDPCTQDETGRLMYEVPIFHGLATEYPECQWDYFVRHYSDQET